MDRLIPGSHKFYGGLVKFGLKRMQKSSGADIVGFRPAANGTIVPEPMKVVHEEGPTDAAKYKAKTDGQKFDVGPSGIGGEYIGKTPVGFFVEDPPRQTSLLEGRIRDAVDLGNTREVYWNPDINLIDFIVEDQQALADGGVAADANIVGQRQVEVTKDELPVDFLIDLSSDSGNGAQVSWFRSNDILTERATTEEMQMQEERGLIAGKSGEDVKKVMKWALLAIVAVVAILVLGPQVVNYIFGGGGGGGGGGFIPIVMGALLP